MNLETKIIIYKFTPQVFTLTPSYLYRTCTKSISCKHGINSISSPFKCNQNKCVQPHKAKTSILFSSVLYSENEGIYYVGHKESTVCNGHDAIA